MTAQQFDQSHDKRELVKGPSREGIFDALRLQHEGRTVTFEDYHYRYIATIKTIESEDGSGDSWVLKGLMVIEPIGMPPGCGTVKPIRRHFICRYRTDQRKGILGFV